MSFVDMSPSAKMLLTDLSIAQARRGWNVFRGYGERAGEEFGVVQIARAAES